MVYSKDVLNGGGLEGKRSEELRGGGGSMERSGGRSRSGVDRCEAEDKRAGYLIKVRRSQTQKVRRAP